ncbi:signal peptidase I [Sphingomonas sp. HF-S3]|uniref:Signal peptidase I n=1 Tax=Sphingomonas rustica TaxID=3103142 RepID=A0ABV0B8R4_9SPHN
MSDPVQPAAPAPDKVQGESWTSTIRFVVLLVVGVFTFQTVAAKPFYIPSSSMMPTLRTGDRLVVSKYPYGWSYASPSIHGATPIPGRLFGGMPERGDIVTVARLSDGADLIKRVIGLPGDTVEVRHSILYLNGKPVPRGPKRMLDLPVDANLPCEGRLEPFRTARADGTAVCRVPTYRETLPGGASYDTIDLGDGDLPGGFFSVADMYAPVTVPAGHVFLMGDNRDESADSRFPLSRGGLGGPVPVESLGGRAEFITHSYDGGGSVLNPISWVSTLRSGRSGLSLRPAHD